MFQRCYKLLNLAEKTITEQSLIGICATFHHGMRQRIDNFVKRTNCEALEGREKLQENVRQSEFHLLPLVHSLQATKKIKTVEN